MAESQHTTDQSVNIDVEPANKRVEPNDSIGRKGMVITFQDLEYVVTNSSNRKEKLSLLKRISGFFDAGRMSALRSFPGRVGSSWHVIHGMQMGPSGSGKTTLLDVVAGRKTQGEIRGSILFAQRPATKMFLRRYTGYVEQFDTLLGTLTVKEMLLYTAELKRPMEESLQRKTAAVESLIEELALAPCANTRIGDALHRGISGGQAKRTNIGVALVTNPRVLFLDEPTSGLDSYTANEVMASVQELSRMGVTICATIHSPSQYSFDLFDNVMMLVRGQMVFFGPRQGAMEYFSVNLPDMKSTLPVTNDAEWLTDVITRGDRDGKGTRMAEAYAKSELCEQMQRTLRSHMESQSTVDEMTLQELNVERATATPFYWGLRTLLKYRTTANYKNPEFLGPRLGDKIITSLLIMTLYWGKGDDLDSDNVQNISAALFMWCTLPAFGAASYVPAIVLERPLYVRERNDGLYRSMTYLVAKMCDELLLAFLISLVFSCIVWFPIDFRGEWVLFWLVYLVTLSIGIVLAYFVASLSPNMDVANASLPAYVVTLLFFAGFLIRTKDIPDYWIWYSYINFLRYAWGSLVINSFEGQDAQFQDQPVLVFYDLDDVSKWTYLGIECVFFVVFFAAAWVGITFKRQALR